MLARSISADTIFANFGPASSFNASKGFSCGLELSQEGDPDRYFTIAAICRPSHCAVDDDGEGAFRVSGDLAPVPEPASVS